MDINYDPSTMIKKIQLLIRNDNLEQSMASNENDNEYDGTENSRRFQLFMHYPRQLLRTAAIHDEPILGINSTLTGTKFTLKQMEVTLKISFNETKWIKHLIRYYKYHQNFNELKQVLRRRDGGKHQRCNKNYKQDDNYIRYEIVKREGCVPPHWRKHFLDNLDFDMDEFRDCKTKEELKKVRTPSPSFVHSEFLFKYTFPCDSMFYISLKKETTFNSKLGW